jgi:hypothetical protein
MMIEFDIETDDNVDKELDNRIDGFKLMSMENESMEERGMS